MIDPELQTISNLLKEESQFVVPDYQRAYAWTNEEVGEFIDDVWAYMGREEGLYLGTIILDTSGKRRKKIAIVDGQQRITTVFLCLIAIREHARSLNESQRVHAIQQKITFTDELNNQTVGMKLLASPSIRKVFDHMADSEWKGDFPVDLGRLAIRKVKPVYDAFQQKLKSLDHAELHKLQASVYATQVMRINIDTPDEAFSIFERTNARGMDLEVADLLKNFLYQKKIKTIREDWQEIVRNAAHGMLRMLRSFYIAYKGHVQKASLYKSLKKLSEDFGAELMLQRLKGFSVYFSYLRNLNTNSDVTKLFFESAHLTCISKHQDRFVEVHNSLLALNEFGIVQTQPVIYAAILAIQRLKLQKDAETAKVFVKFVQGLEAFHFVNTFVCSHIGNEVEQIYADASKSFSTASKFSMPVEKLLNDLRKRKASFQEFQENFVQIEYSEKRLGKVAYLFDRLNNKGRKIGERKAIFYPDSSIFRRHYNVEHIYPQKSKNGEGPAVSLSRINNVGNLTVMSTQLNSQLGNKSAEEKFHLMAGQLSNRVAEFPALVKMVKQYGVQPFVWDDGTIQARAKALAEESYSVMGTF